MSTSETTQPETVQAEAATMVTANPKINATETTVQNILADLNTRAKSPASYQVTGTIPLPSWFGFDYHFQGIAPYNGGGSSPNIINGCISASSTKGYFADFTQGMNGNGTPGAATVCAVTYPDDSYYHAAGIQMLGDLLPVSMESKDDAKNGMISCYNVGNLHSPQFLYNVMMPEHKASAVAVTTYTGKDEHGVPVEYALMAVYEYDPRYMRFFQAKASDIGNSENPWTQVAYYQGDALEGDQFQCFAMVTQVNLDGSNQVYLLGFREDEELHLFTVDTGSTHFGLIGKSTVYKGWSGSDWRNGVGLQIPDPRTMRIFGTDKDPEGDSNNYKFKVYVWS